VNLWSPLSGACFLENGGKKRWIEPSLSRLDFGEGRKRNPEKACGLTLRLWILYCRPDGGYALLAWGDSFGLGLGTDDGEIWLIKLAPNGKKMK
jgi:hypothetical protein